MADDPVEAMFQRLDGTLRRVASPALAGELATCHFHQLEDDYRRQPWTFSPAQLERLRAVPDRLEALATLASITAAAATVETVDDATALLVELERLRPLLDGAASQLVALRLSRDLVRRGTLLMRRAS